MPAKVDSEEFRSKKQTLTRTWPSRAKSSFLLWSRHASRGLRTAGHADTDRNRSLPFGAQIPRQIKFSSSEKWKLNFAYSPCASAYRICIPFT